MEWLIGIICIVIVVVFWRIFVPLGILAVVGIGLFVIIMLHMDKKEELKIKREAAALPHQTR